ncbi:hypothetical protein B0H13DRAFT_1583875, partial [Mycena leptocephala]
APSDNNNILGLHGVAGSAKSTIATTVSEYLRHLRRLGVYLFYSRSTESRPDSVIRTIAYQLATVNYHMAAQIAAA